MYLQGPPMHRPPNQGGPPHQGGPPPQFGGPPLHQGGPRGPPGPQGHPPPMQQGPHQGMSLRLLDYYLTSKDSVREKFLPPTQPSLRPTWLSF